MEVLMVLLLVFGIPIIWAQMSANKHGEKEREEERHNELMDKLEEIRSDAELVHDLGDVSLPTDDLKDEPDLTDPKEFHKRLNEITLSHGLSEVKLIDDAPVQDPENNEFGITFVRKNPPPR